MQIACAMTSSISVNMDKGRARQVRHVRSAQVGLLLHAPALLHDAHFRRSSCSRTQCVAFAVGRPVGCARHASIGLYAGGQPGRATSDIDRDSTLDFGLGRGSAMPQVPSRNRMTSDRPYRPVLCAGARHKHGAQPNGGCQIGRNASFHAMLHEISRS